MVAIYELYPDIMDVIDVMKGREFENFCAELLKRNEFRDVTLTPASRDYGIDITARYHNRIYGIQCKRNKNKIGNDVIQKVSGSADFYYCDAAVVLTNSTFTKAAIEQAGRSGVRLWDRDQLIDFIDKCDEPEFIQQYIAKYKINNYDRQDDKSFKDNSCKATEYQSSNKKPNNILCSIFV